MSRNIRRSILFGTFLLFATPACAQYIDHIPLPSCPCYHLPLTSGECYARIQFAIDQNFIDPEVDFTMDGEYGIRDFGFCKRFPTEATIEHKPTCRPASRGECSARVGAALGQDAAVDSGADMDLDGTITMKDWGLCKSITLPGGSVDD